MTETDKAPPKIFIDPDDVFNPQTTFCTLAYESVTTEYTRTDLANQQSKAERNKALRDAADIPKMAKESLIPITTDEEAAAYYAIHTIEGEIRALITDENYVEEMTYSPHRVTDDELIKLSSSDEQLVPEIMTLWGSRGMAGNWEFNDFYSGAHDTHTITGIIEPIEIAELEGALTLAKTERTKPRVDEWQPIETAPKDVEVLVYSDAWNVPYLIKATRREHGWTSGGFDLSNPHQPTHWMPLPEPPRVSGGVE